MAIGIGLSWGAGQRPPPEHQESSVSLSVKWRFRKRHHRPVLANLQRGGKAGEGDGSERLAPISSAPCREGGTVTAARWPGGDTGAGDRVVLPPARARCARSGVPCTRALSPPASVPGGIGKRPGRPASQAAERDSELSATLPRLSTATVCRHRSRKPNTQRLPPGPPLRFQGSDRRCPVRSKRKKKSTVTSEAGGRVRLLVPRCPRSPQGLRACGVRR